MNQFSIVRHDGRSNQQVIVDMVRGAEPGTIFPYESFASELARGTARTYNRRAVASTVRSANPRLLREERRELRNVPTIGYKVAHAKEHLELATNRKARADRQISRGLKTLRNVRWDELDPNARAAHEGTLLVVEGLYAQMQAFARRQAAQDEAIKRIAKRLDDVLPDEK
jgi:hypothetical protein